MSDGPEATPDLKGWLATIIPKHERLAAAVHHLLESMLRRENIDFLSVTSRTKTVEGAIEKVSRKEYDDPQSQLTDLSGIRVVTYLEEQVDQITKVVRSLFEIDEPNSLNRGDILGDDKVGYRSTHFVGTLGGSREQLPEYAELGTLKFEIQVRTVLQHAWAELAHDRAFKFGIALPKKIQRKLNLYSGMLEIADAAFDDISKEIDAYSKELKDKSLSQIATAELDTISILTFAKELTRTAVLFQDETLTPAILRELREFGIERIGELEALISADFITAHLAVGGAKYSLTGFLRRAMLFNDLERFFQDVRPGFRKMTPSTYAMLKRRYDPSFIDEVMTRAGVSLQRPRT